ncbi:fatty-acid--CoA ligase FadD8 [Paractinoplanes rishiriensis]|uniref:Fatty-acyl-CoA synthase n=1 Tax=Paractinoplanes rishiriensis TaxID=1050105 RepID=A0A919JY34_9ACTN|nr:fatty-acid--CoA ligase FadD8 [Actinoplanes rishiriensis]GIE95620.1 fatty-acyl-CoA synthase [Actinoplanes rishiriensis]
MGLRQPNHLGHLVAAALARHRDRPVLELGDTTLTGAATAAAMSRYVQAFQSLGVGTDGAAALLATNRPEVLLIIGASQMLGSRRTALHPLGSLDDHAYALDDAAIGTLIVDPLFADRALGLLERVPCLKQVLTIGPVPGALAGAGAVDLTAVAAGFEPQPLRPADLPPDHIVSVTYTGGTTGKPKGVTGTAHSMLTMCQIQLAEWEWPPEPRFLVCTPLSHAGAAFFVPTLIKGGSMVVLPRFDPAEVLRTVEEQRITATMLVPTMLYALLDHPDAATRDLSSLATVYYGAAAINPVRLREAIDRFGPIFAQFYGQTEAPMAISYLARHEHDDARLSSCGRPSAFLRTALLDEAGNRVAPGEPGEICVAGPLLAAGYRNKPDATAEAFRDGWLRTGDVARQDEDGFWHIVDRVKDMIVTGGFNVFPREVEDAVAGHPAVAQVGVIGVPDSTWGEAVTAVVVLRPGVSASGRLTEEIKAAVRDRKGPVHVPKNVIVTDRLPLTALGKPDKKALRASFSSPGREPPTARG